jgi:hypothetical protein
MTNTDTPRNLLLALAALTAAGSLLPWATITAPFVGTINVPGTDGDGLITLGLAVLLATFAAVRRYRWAAAAAAVAGLVALVSVGNVADAARSAEADGIVTASVGAGLWVVLLASLIAVVVGLAGRRPAVAAERPGPTYPAPPPYVG